MSIAFDSVTWSNDSGSSPITNSVQHTCGGSDRLVLVHVVTNNNPASGVTYGGVAMTQLGTSLTDANGSRHTFWGLLNPTTSAANVVTTAASTVFARVTVVSYTGVKQSGLPDSQAQGTGVLGVTTPTTTVVASNCWLACFAETDNQTFTAGANTIIRDQSQNGEISADSNGIVGTGSQSLNFTHASIASIWNVISIAPSASLANSGFFAAATR